MIDLADIKKSLALHVRWVLSIPLLATAVVLPLLTLIGLRYTGSIVSFDNELNAHALKSVDLGVYNALTTAAGIAAVVCLLLAPAGIAALRLRRTWVLPALRKAYAVSYLLMAVYSVAAVAVLQLIENSQLVVGLSPLTSGEMSAAKAAFILPVLMLLAVVALAHWIARRGMAAEYYGGGAVISRSARSESIGGADPVFRRMMIGSLVGHAVVLVLVPWLLFSSGIRSIADFKAPGGGGGSSGAKEVKIAPKVQKKARRRNYTLSLNSPISFYVPKIEESDIGRELVDATENVYKTSGTGRGEGTGSGFGKGSGKGGGWGGGYADSLVRFIRLEHGGQGWDDGMNSGDRAEMNFLEALKKESGFRVATDFEHYSIASLRTSRKGKAPPFVYMTGTGHIADVSNGDIKILRQYLNDGGMLFVDCGSGTFDLSFRAFVQRLYPDKPLVDIPNDDSLFRVPFAFPNGAPPLWHHGGKRCLGVKDAGRWSVFYFPGDLKDAWKTGGSGLDKSKVTQAYQLGMNVLYYAFTNYTEMYPSNQK